MKIKNWDPRKEKKARFKRSINRHMKRGGKIYGGYVKIDFIRKIDQ